MNNEKGNILILVFFAFGLILFASLFLTAGSQTYFQNAQYHYNAEQATNIAEAGLEKAFASLNATWGSYNGESGTIFGQGVFTTEIADKDQNTKIITSTGFIPDAQNPKSKRVISIEVAGQSSVYTIIEGTYQIK